MVSRSLFPDQEENLATSRKLGVVSDIMLEEGTKPMVDAVLGAVSEGQLSRFFIHLSRVPATTDTALLSRAVTRVRDCDIIGGGSAQNQAILAAVVESTDLALNTLRVLGNTTQVSEDILAGAAVRLNTFCVTEITTAQLGEILTRLATTEDAKLRRLELWVNGGRSDLTQLPQNTVAEALMKLENIDLILGRVRLSSEQLTSLFTKRNLM